MATETATQPAKPTAVDALVRRATSLYSLPAVAAQVIQLTDNPSVDTRALKECIEADPALTAKILRVVNSSLFGLSREVCDLNQALALLGTKPLKLLVLGFSLPDSLFAKVAREQLDWYWTTTLNRAVAAREISEQLFDRPGDDAFLAGLFQDIGVLVLLGELKEPYANFLSGVIEQRVDLLRLEVDSLGFDHLQLTAALLEHWKMPRLLVQSISEPRDQPALKRNNAEHVTVAKILHLAELVAELVGQNRLGVLPDLLEIGADYCELDKESLNVLVGTLQPKVQQLAEVLSLDGVVEEQDYVAIITAAHEQMSALNEEVVGLLGEPPVAAEREYADLLADATELRRAVDEFVGRGAVATPERAVASPPAEADSPGEALGNAPAMDFNKRLTLAIGDCRSRRQPVSVLMLELAGESGADAQAVQLLGQVLDMATKTIDTPGVLRDLPHPCRRVLVLPGHERQEVVRLAEGLIGRIAKMSERLATKGTVLKYVASAGVSCVTLPPKNFPPQDLLEAAERCLAGAQSSGASVVKSLEIF